MLESETKRRIDTARDILVGKVPDPKSQVEQITIALIYKFMDDMDRESVEMGGKASFFTGQYKRYRWSAIVDPRMSGHEMIGLYAEAIVQLNQNTAIPQLFRDIFKNAYLPYRDPETLKLFLRTINEFEYDHSENLGDAFEYLLSVLGSQGDAGQFRTPRNIIDFMVEVIDPLKNETIIDPACGTAGFLISSYKHIMQANTAKKGERSSLGDLLTTAERKKLFSNFSGYDISPDMVRLSLANLYLHGFNQPKIVEYDTLTSDERWNEYADVILANPPFMSPKGGIKPHKKFSVQSSRSEVLFVDYIAEHLTPTGRAAVIVPEGIIFQSGSAYKQLRKMLVDKYLFAVVSLPAGVFNPYSGVKTSILFLDPSLARKSDSILFVKIEHDGFSLGAQRRAIERNDLPEAVRAIQTYRRFITQRRKGAENAEGGMKAEVNSLVVSKEKIADGGEYNLTGERYRVEKRRGKQKWPLVKLGDVARLINGRAFKQEELLTEGKTLVLRVGNFFSNRGWYYSDLDLEPDKYCNTGDLLFAWSASFGPRIWEGQRVIYHYHIWKIEPTEAIDKFFLFHLLKIDSESIKAEGHGIAMMHITKSNMEKRKFPLPPLEVQRKIVAEIEGYQKIIDGARQVVDNWKPHIDVDPDWPMVKLGEAPIEIIDGDRGVNYPKKEDFTTKGYCLFLNTSNVRKGYFNFENNQFINEHKDKMLRKGKLKCNDIVLTTRGTIGNISHYNKNISYKNVRINSGMVLLRVDPKNFDPLFIVQYFLSKLAEVQMQKILSGSAQPQLPIRSLVEFKIPHPSLEVQREIVEKIEAERKMIDNCRELIALYEQKIKQIVEGVWG